MTGDSIVAEHVNKRFRIVRIPKAISLKEAVITRQLFKRPPRDELCVDALKDVSFSVKRGEMLGVVGRNGSGKTTLMRVLGGIYKPDSGTVSIVGGYAPLLSLGLGFHPDMSGRENIKMNGLILGLSPREIEHRLDEIVDFAELREYLDVPLRMYSSGMYMRLAFSVAITIDPEVLLLDEVLAVGDALFVAKCVEKMREFRHSGKTIVFVSHDGLSVKAWCDRALWMEAGALRMAGTSEDVVTAYDSHAKLAIAERELLRAIE